MKYIKLLVLPALAALLYARAGGYTVPPAVAAPGCGLPNTAFQAGELIGFNVYYTVGNMVNVNAGTGTVGITAEKLNGKSVYHIKATGKTQPSYEWAFKAYDTYESWVDAETLQPLKFIRNISEGSFKKYQTASFNKTANTVVTNDGVYKMPVCVQDVVSAMYYCRNIDFNKLRTNDRVAFNLYLDNEVHGLYVRYEGKEVITTKYGKFNAIRLKPLTLRGNVFEGGEKLTVWISDDANHAPLRAESPILVGRIRVDMTSFQGLRNPMSALIKR